METKTKLNLKYLKILKQLLEILGPKSSVEVFTNYSKILSTCYVYLSTNIINSDDFSKIEAVIGSFQIHPYNKRILITLDKINY